MNISSLQMAIILVSVAIIYAVKELETQNCLRKFGMDLEQVCEPVDVNVGREIDRMVQSIVPDPENDLAVIQLVPDHFVR